ncbi:hypothetical protein KM043_001122 [Ampulex compressa]|nr:hypothetical protein KM043_001122 [Ampulex compressa]
MATAIAAVPPTSNKSLKPTPTTSPRAAPDTSLIPHPFLPIAQPYSALNPPKAGILLAFSPKRPGIARARDAIDPSCPPGDASQRDQSGFHQAAPLPGASRGDRPR